MNPMRISKRGRTGFRVAVLAAVLAIGAATAAAQRTPAPLSGRLVITGSSTLEPVVVELAKRFRSRHPGVELVVEPGGSGRGVSDALDGKADIGMVSRELSVKEKSLFVIPIARDGIVFVVHKDNPVRRITRAQALAILTGKTADWSELGAPAGPIEAVTRGPGRGSTETASHYFGIAPEAIKGKHEAGENSAVVRLVAANRSVIAFMSVGAAEDSMQKGLPLRMLPLDGIVPGSGAVRDGSWPMSRPLNLVTRKVPAGAAKAFIEFALSAEAYPVIAQHDYVPYAR